MTIKAETRWIQLEVRSSARRIAGFACFWTCTWFLVQNSLIAGAPDPQAYESSFVWMLSTFFYALGFLLLGVLCKLRGVVALGSTCRNVVVPVMAGIGTIITMEFPPMGTGNTASFALYIAGCAASGFSMALLQAEWMRLMGRIGSRKVAVVVAAGVIVAAAMSSLAFMAQGALVIAGCAPTIASSPLAAMLVALPFISVRCLSKDPAMSKKSAGRTDDSPEVVPWALMATALVIGVSSGAMDAAAALLGSTLPVYAVLGSFVIGATLMLVVAALRHLDYNMIFYKIAIPLMALSWLFAALTRTLAPPAPFAHALAYEFAEVALWILMVTIVNHEGLRSNMVCAYGMCSLVVGRFAGTLLAEPLGATGAGFDIGQLGTLLAVGLAGSCIYLRSERNTRTGWGLIRPAESDDVPVFDKTLEIMCADYSLTPREREVFALLAHGRNRAFIAEELTLSKETVKIHIRNVYSKLNVHSQQDLITKVNDEIASLERDME